MTMEEGIRKYYSDKRAEATKLSAELKKAKENGATKEEIRSLERRLELARYVGD